MTTHIFMRIKRAAAFTQVTHANPPVVWRFWFSWTLPINYTLYKNRWLYWKQRKFLPIKRHLADTSLKPSWLYYKCDKLLPSSRAPAGVLLEYRRVNGWKKWPLFMLFVFRHTCTHTKKAPTIFRCVNPRFQSGMLRSCDWARHLLFRGDAIIICLLECYKALGRNNAPVVKACAPFWWAIRCTSPRLCFPAGPGRGQRSLAQGRIFGALETTQTTGDKGSSSGKPAVHFTTENLCTLERETGDERTARSGALVWLGQVAKTGRPAWLAANGLSFIHWLI